MMAATSTVATARLRAMTRQLVKPMAISSGFRRRSQRAQAAGSHHPAGQRRLPLGREPQGEGLEGGHQAGRYAEADQGAADGQAAQCVGQGQRWHAGPAISNNPDFHAARAVAVEQHAERQLGCAKSQEIGAGQQAQGVVGQLQFAGEHRAR